VAAHEIMIGTPAIRNLIRENKIAQMYSMIQTSQSFGMQTLDQNLADLVKRNMVSATEAHQGQAARKLPWRLSQPRRTTGAIRTLPIFSLAPSRP
jgi:pilus retraction ATPase PilT